MPIATNKEDAERFYQKRYDTYIKLAEEGVYGDLNQYSLAADDVENGDWPANKDEYQIITDAPTINRQVQWLKALRSVVITLSQEGYIIEDFDIKMDEEYEEDYLKVLAEGGTATTTMAIMDAMLAQGRLELTKYEDDGELNAAAPAEVTTLLAPLPVAIKQEPLDEGDMAPTREYQRTIFNSLMESRQKWRLPLHDKEWLAQEILKHKTNRDLTNWQENMAIKDRPSKAVMDNARALFGLSRTYGVYYDANLIIDSLRHAEAKGKLKETILELKASLEKYVKERDASKVSSAMAAPPMAAPSATPPATPPSAPSATPITQPPAAPAIAASGDELHRLQQQQIGIDKLSAYLHDDKPTKTRSKSSGASSDELAKAQAKADAWWSVHPRGKNRDMSHKSKKVVTDASKYVPSKNDFRGLDDGSKKHLVKWSR